MQPIRNYAHYVCLGLALSAGCTMETADEGEALSETAQDLYVQNGTTLWQRNALVPICFAYGSGATTIPNDQRAAVTAFVKERIKLTWGAVLPLQFRFRDCPTTDDAGSDVLVDLSWQDNAGMCFTTGTGLLTKASQRTGDIAWAWGCHISITPDWNANAERLLYNQRLLLHEFGHLLGFAHEFNRPDAAGQPCAAPHAPGGTTLGSYDPDSIMLSTYGCRNPDQYWLSAGDVANARALYGTRYANIAGKDIVWQSTDGNVAIWRMDGVIRRSEYFVPGTIGTAYKVIGAGDFDGDNIGDLLWRGPDGAVVVWLQNANGTTRTSSYIPFSADNTLVGVAKFNSDDRSDVMWRTPTGALVTWMMNGIAIGYTRQIAAWEWSWQIKQVGDFDGDGQADLFARHVFGPTAVWLLKDGLVVQNAQTGAEVETAWVSAGAGDFNGDGKTDLLWHNTVDYRTSIWFMNGTAIGSWSLVAGTGPGWAVQGVADVDVDGRADVLFRHTSGSNRVWVMDGAAIRMNMPLPFASTPWSMRGTLRGRISPAN